MWRLISDVISSLQSLLHSMNVICTEDYLPQSIPSLQMGHAHKQKLQDTATLSEGP